MRFIGNKEKLLPFIDSVIEDKKAEGDIFCDFFAGTGNVGKYFKEKNYKIISSDILYFSYVLQKAYIANNTVPTFENIITSISTNRGALFSSNLEHVVNHLNKLEPKKGFIYKNYSPEGTKGKEIKRMFFTGENAGMIDAIRQEIEKWKKAKKINENEYFILLACLIESVPFYANISGTYATFLKEWDPRAIKKFALRPIKLITSEQEHVVKNIDSMDILPSLNCDILYLDPPYNHRQYAPNYHLLETIAKYDNPTIKGVGGLREYSNQKSDFCNKDKALSALEKITKEANFKYLLLSYNTEGIMPDKQIRKTLSRVGDVHVEPLKYRRFKSNNNGLAKTKKYIKELIYFVEKN